MNKLFSIVVLVSALIAGILVLQLILRRAKRFALLYPAHVKFSLSEQFVVMAISRKIKMWHIISVILVAAGFVISYYISRTQSDILWALGFSGIAFVFFERRGVQSMLLDSEKTQLLGKIVRDGIR